MSRASMVGGVMDSLDHGVWHCWYLCGRTKVRVFRSLVLPVLLCGCETWTLTSDLRWRLNFLGYQVSLENPWLLLVELCVQRAVAERDSNEICYLHHLCQLRLYGHVARFPDADPAHQILSAREPCEWRWPMGRPRASWLQQVYRHLKEMGMGQASAWGMARRRPLESGFSNVLLRRMLPYLT